MANKSSLFEGFLLSEDIKEILSRIWETNIECFNGAAKQSRHRPYQSDLSQDEQQRIMISIAPHLKANLPVDTIDRLRALCIARQNDDFRTKETLQWAIRTDLILRAMGELPIAIKVIVDATTAASTKRVSSLSQVAEHRELDPSLVIIPDLDVYETALLHEVIAKVKQEKKSQTILVLIYILIGRTKWPHQEYDTHVTKLTLHPDMTAQYEDHAMSEITRLKLSDRYMWYRSKGKGRGKIYVDPLTEGNLSSEVPVNKKRRTSGPTRPDWACDNYVDDEGGQVLKFPLRNRWCVRVYEGLQRQLFNFGVSLSHTQQFEYQAWNVAQCALAMLFDSHLNIPDHQRSVICTQFASHPCVIDQKVSLKKHEDKRGNNTMLHLYERWLWENHRVIFQQAEKWCEDNSLRIGDILSAGCCDVCNQFDSPEAIMLCEVEDCPAALHYFCSTPPSTTLPKTPWYCDKHLQMASCSSSTTYQAIS